jgi:RNA polymerase sigma factor (sigma-70 family)
MRAQRLLDAREQAAFDSVFSAEFASIHRYVRRRVGRDAADDVAAGTFLAAYANWHRFDQTRPVRPWLYGIATNLLRHHYRDEERKLRAYARTGIDPIAWEDESEVVRRLDASARQRELAAALADLRPEDREILLLHAWAELSDDEIAASRSLPTGTVKSRLHRTRVRLRNLIAISGQPDGETATASKKEFR